MTILITGASGSVAKIFVQQVAAFFDDSIVLTGRKVLNIPNYIPCDLINRQAVEYLLLKAKPRLIFHLAGSFSGNFSVDFSSNVLSTQVLFDVLAEEKISCRTIILGSAAEYGYVMPEENPISELYPLNPASVYGFTKATQTRLAMFYHATKGLDIIVARVFNLMASGLSERLFVGRVENLISQYKIGEIEKIHVRSLDSQRDYICLKEASKQIIHLSQKGKSGDVYNVGNGRPVGLRDLLREILSKEGIGMENVVEEVNPLKSNIIDVPIIYADMKKTFSLIRNEIPVSELT